MSWNKVMPRVRHLGYCCLWAFLRAHKETGTKELSDLLEVTPRTVRYLRQRLSPSCEKRPTCLKEAAVRLRKHLPEID
jgi:hypothetical protein